MIIQCDHCSAKFRMDDSKLASGAVKVRCAKCKQVFIVKKDLEQAEISPPPAAPESAAEVGQVAGGEAPGGAAADFDFGQVDFAGGVAITDAGFSFGSDNTSGQADASAVDGGSQEEVANEFDWKDSSGYGESAGSSPFDMTGFSEEAAGREGAATSAAVAGDSDFDFGDVQLDEPPVSQPAIEAAAAHGKDDFAIDFGDVSFPESSRDESPASFDLSFSPEAQGAGQSDRPVASIDEKGDTDDFLLSFGSEAPAASAARPAAVDFGDFDFGEMESTPVAKPGGMPEAAIPAAVAMPESAPDISFESDQEELPPSSLSTRKKRGSLFPLLVILGAILLVLALAGSGVYFFGGPKLFSKVGLGFLVEWYGQKGAEEGNITVRNLSAEYIVNKEAGELFVVRGEAVNNFKKPRASIQIKVAVLGRGGASLKAKTAFCGNSLSNEQLTNIPLAKIEETMNNQFGDSLANLGVKPGNAIPFVVALSAVPKDATDYSVQVGGSTVATQ